jgi:glycosyltransferase involved in cell wall biosynthesis/uncharacterized membrane protein YbhN (UPF0104 family)/O-antigen ligase
MPEQESTQAARVKTRLLVVCNQLAHGGTENQVITLLKELKEADIERSLFLLDASDFPTRELEDSGVRIYAPRWSSRWTALTLVFAMFRYLRLQLTESFDIVHFFLPASYIVGGLSALLVGPRCRVMSRRSLNNYQRAHLFAALIERFLHKRMSAITGNSQAVCAQLCDEMSPVDATKISLIGNGVTVHPDHGRDRIRAEVRKTYGLSDDGLVLIMTANLFSYKGHADLMDALGSIKSELPNSWALICMGRDSGAMANAVAKAKLNGIDQHVHWLGAVDTSTVLRMNLSADISVLPSHQEGLPNALLEAQAAGIAIVATDVGGVSDIIDSPNVGKIVPPREPMLLGQAILEFANDPLLRLTTAEAGKRQVSKRFSVASMASQYRKLYAAIVENTAKSVALSKDDRTMRPKTILQYTASALLTVGLLFVALHIIDPERIEAQFLDYPIWYLGFIFIVLFINVLVTSARFHFLLNKFQASIPWGVSLRAALAGNLVGLVTLPIVGPIVGRHAILAKNRIPSGLTAGIFLYERFIVAMSSGIIGISGTWYLMNDNVLMPLAYDESAFMAILVIVLSLILSIAFFGDAWEKRTIRIMLSRPALKVSLSACLLSFLGQFFVISAFTIAIQPLISDIPMLSILAASAIVSFAAAVPISINGWGVREVTAIGVFGLLGVEPSAALFVSVLVGIASTVSLLSLAPILLLQSRSLDSQPKKKDSGPVGQVFRDKLDRGNNTTSFLDSMGVLKRADINGLIAWSLAMLTAALIFFYPKIQIGAFSISVNLADPIALVAGVAFVLHLVSLRRLPVWHIKMMNGWFVLASCTLVISYVIGYMDFGPTPWATLKRLGGWPILLSYVAAGAFVISTTSERNVARIVETMVICLLISLLVEIISRLIGPLTTINLYSIYLPLNGFSGNRNSFAFSEIIALAGVLAFSAKWVKDGRSLFCAICIGIILLGQIFTQSKAGIGASIIIIMLAYFLNIADRKVIRLGLALVFSIFLSAGLIYAILNTGQPLYASPFIQGNDALQLRALYNNYRWDTLKDGLALWQAAPIMGSGLGKFIFESERLYGQPFVIHNSLVWLLAEMGLIGAFVFCGQFFRILWLASKQSLLGTSPEMRFLMLTLISFGLFSTVHDMMYHRVLWFVLGATLIAPGSLRVVITKDAHLKSD